MAPRPIKVTITFCSECGYQPQALELTSALLYAFSYGLSAIELIPWHEGTFEVSVDGRLVHSMAREGGFPESNLIVDAVRAGLVGGTP
jgi:selenoprotein W-related protein